MAYVFLKGNPFAKVIQVTDQRLEVWGVSREDTVGDTLEKLKNFDTSIQDLYKVCVHFNASAGFRELLTGLRPYAMWSQSSRNKDIRDIQVNTYLGHEQYEIINELMKKCYSLTDSKDQDVGRMYLPLAHLGEFYYEAPVRLLVSVWKSLRNVAPEYNEIWLDPIFDQLEINPYELVYKPAHLEFGLQDEFRDGIHTLNGIKIIAKTLPIGLRAQLARQSRVYLRDNIWNLVSNKGFLGFESLNLMDTVDTVSVMSQNSYERICKMRSCFIASVDLWYDYLLQGYEEVGFPNILPCQGDRCKCAVALEAEDAAIRNAATPPCPIFESDRYFFDIRADNAVDDTLYKTMLDYFSKIPNREGKLERLQNKEHELNKEVAHLLEEKP